MTSQSYGRARGQTATLRFAEQFYKWMAKASGSTSDIQPMDWPEIAHALNAANDLMSVAEPTTVKAIYDRNPNIAWKLASRDADGATAMLAGLPLNSAGAVALISGAMNTMAPDPAWIARTPGDAEAFYIWLLFAPGRLADGMLLLDHIACSPHHGRLPLFSRAVTRTAQRLQNGAGFIDANMIYPTAPADLQVLLPEKQGPVGKLSRAKLEVSVVRNMEDLMKVFSIRSAVYVAEQLPTYEEEFDGNDYCATHLLGHVNGEPAGCVRVRYFGDFAKLERLAVRREYRPSKLGYALARAAIAHCRRKNFRRLYAHIRSDMVPMWKGIGAVPMPDRQAFRFSDIEFRELVLELDEADDAIRLGDDPMLMIRPEGAWDELGPLDHSVLVNDRSRQQHIEDALGMKARP